MYVYLYTPSLHQNKQNICAIDSSNQKGSVPLCYIIRSCKISAEMGESSVLVLGLKKDEKWMIINIAFGCWYLVLPRIETQMKLILFIMVQ